MKVKLLIPKKYEHAIEVIGVPMPEKGNVVEVDAAKVHRFKRLGFTETKEVKTGGK